MSTKLAERITKAKDRVAKLEQQRRLEERREREAKRKKDQRRNYIIGDLVTKHFPEISRFEPGNTAEFAPFETFLSVLAANQGVMARLKGEVGQRLSSTSQDQ